MSVSDKPSTLRAQMKHHEPIVCMAIKTKQIDMRTAHETAHPLDGNDDKEPQAVCYERNNSQDGKCYTLNTIERHAVCYIIDAISSNSFKSDNPHSGIHETEVSKCLDTMCLNPSCNQGGVMICYTVDCRNNCLNPEVSGTLQAHNDGGWSINCTNPVMYETDDE